MSLPVACVIGDLSLVRPLGLAGIPVALASADPRSSAARSRFVREVVLIPSFVEEPEAAVQALLRWAARQDEPPVLFYQGDHDLLAVSEHRAVLAPALRLVLPESELVLDLVDKLRFAALAHRLTLPVPRTLTVRRGHTDEAWAFDAFPCVLKPAVRTRWFGSALHPADSPNQKALRIESHAELVRLVPLIEAHDADMILQAAIDGGEERIVSYHAYVRPGGEVVAEVSGRKHRTSPRRYGLSTYVEITDEQDVLRLGREVVQKLGFNGVIKIDFKRDPRDERLFMLEANPRFNLWHHPAALAGQNLPALYYQDCLAPGSAPIQEVVRPGVRWMSTRADLRALGEYRAAGEATMLGWAVEWLKADITEDWMWRDPLPGLQDIGDTFWRKLRQRLASHRREAA